MEALPEAVIWNVALSYCVTLSNVCGKARSSFETPYLVYRTGEIDALFQRLALLSGVLCSVAWGQFGYEGPSILSGGSQGIGTRGGEQVDLRFFANLNAIYDTGLLPIATDVHGTITNSGALFGVEGQIGGYGVHSWRKAQLGLEYSGDYRHYTENSYYDGSDQHLLLGFTYQKSRRMIFNFRQMVGTYSNSFGSAFAVSGTTLNDVQNTTGTLLFDNRSTFLQSAGSMTYVMSPRNSFSVGGEGYNVLRQSRSLIGLNGYTLHGTFEHRLSQRTSIGVTYSHYHYDFPSAFGESTINSYMGGFARGFDRNRWFLKVQGGIMQTETEGLTTVTLDPAIAEILGVPTIVETYYTKSTLPTGDISLVRKFKNAALSLDYTRGINPGNGVYLTSKQEMAGVSVSYTGVQKVSMGLSANYGTYSSLGQTLGQYRSFGAAYTGSYAITRALHLVGTVAYRKQDIQSSSFLNNAYRFSVGVAFSPGDIPLSLW
jgi:hypothetical protein